MYIINHKQVMKGHLIIKSVHFQHLCLRTVSFTHSLLVQPVHRNYTSCSFPVCQSSYIPMALLQLTGSFDTIQELLPVCQPIYQCVQHNDLSLLLNPLAHLIQECTLLNDRIWYCFDNYFTYFVPVFKYCYSDSRNL